MSELRSQRWQWLLAEDAKETDTKPIVKEANVGGWVASKTKGTLSELTLEEVDLLPKVQHNLMQEEITFQEKLLPPSQMPLATATFDFVARHREVTAAGEGKPNYSGARVPLQNVKINANRMAEMLAAIGYKDLQFVDYLRFGWPLGDKEDPAYSWPMRKGNLSSARANRLSAYQDYNFVDKFINKQVQANRIAGPFSLERSPFGDILPHVVSLKTTETAGKKRLILQTFTLNHHTPSSVFPDGAPPFRRPHIFQFAKELSKKGQGAWMWKRDLSSYYLQIPIDPKDYPKLRYVASFQTMMTTFPSFIWRGSLYFFPTYIWGLKQANNNAQRVSEAVAAIHRAKGFLVQVRNSYGYKV